MIRANFFLAAIVLTFAACGGKSATNQNGAANGQQATPSPQPGRWTVGTNLSPYDLLAIDFVDAQNGWAVGAVRNLHPGWPGRTDHEREGPLDGCSPWHGDSCPSRGGTADGIAYLTTV